MFVARMRSIGPLKNDVQIPRGGGEHHGRPNADASHLDTTCAGGWCRRPALRTNAIADPLPVFHEARGPRPVDIARQDQHVWLSHPGAFARRVDVLDHARAQVE